MPTVHFTSHLKNFVDGPLPNVSGTTVRELLDCVFGERPKLRGYVLDELGSLRTHVVIYISDRVMADRVGLSDAVAATEELYVMQALSGG